MGKNDLEKSEVTEITEKTNTIELAESEDELIPPVVKPDVKPKGKAKRVLSDEHREKLRKQLAIAREKKKQMAEESKNAKQSFLSKKEKELEEKMMQKIKNLQKKKERELMTRYLSEKSDGDESDDEKPVMKKPMKVKKAPVVEYESESEEEEEEEDEPVYQQPQPPVRRLPRFF